MKIERMISRIIDPLKAMSSWRLLLLSVFFSEIFSTIFTSLMSLAFHGGIRQDFLITSGVVALLVSFALAFMLIGLIREVRKANKEIGKHDGLLQEQLRFSQLLIDAIPMPIFYKDTNGVYLGYNRAFEEFLGMPKERLIGKTVHDVAPPELADKYRQMDQELFDHPGVQVYEFSVKHADGTVHEVMFNKATYTDAQGNVAGLIGAMPDITERKRLEQKLAQREAHLRAIIDTEPECVKVLAADGTLLEMNPAGLAMIEADSFEQVAGQNICPFIASQDRPAFEALSEKAFRGESGALEFEIRGLKGTRRWLETHTAPLRNAQGTIVAVLGVTRDITERKRIETALRESEARYRQVVASATDAILVFDAETRQFVEANKAAENMYGYSRDEWLRLRQNAIPVDQAAADAYIRDILTSPTPLRVPLRLHKKKDGTVFPVEISSSVFEANGRKLVCGIIRDITERSKTEAALRRNYDTQTAINWVLHISLEDIPLDSILKQTLDLILSISWLSFESRGAIFLVEGAPDVLVMKVQRGLSDHLKDECRVVPFGGCLCGRAAARGEVQYSSSLDDRHEVRYDGIAPHGHYCVPIMHAKTVLGVINMYLKEGHERDQREIDFLNAIANALAGIIQRKQAEAEREKLIGDLRSVLNTVSRSHKEWRDTFDSITDMISIVDKEYTILKANRAFSAYYGLQPPQVINRKCYELIHDGASPIPNCPHRKTLTENLSAGEEVFDKRTNRTFSIFTFPYRSPEGELLGSIHVMRDVTDEKEKEMRLIMNERLATLGEMASGLAHEINNPLASIAGCSEGLLSRVKKGQWDAALFNTYLNIIQEEVFRCKSITTAMLSFVRKTTYEKKELNLAMVLDKSLEIISFQGRLKHIEVARKYREASPVIRGNEGELRQVFLVVITNALDAMNDKGALTLETDAADGGTVIRISDSGPGIAPDALDKIFSPFFTTKAERGGTGLGLSIARKIVLNHGGTIDVASSPDKGTCFTITLPR